MNFIKLGNRIRQLKCFTIYFVVYFFTLFYKKKHNTWLISERGIDARDNGYVFYKFLKKEHPEILVKFVITYNSPDRRRIDEVDVINYGSLKHYYLYITSPVLISTHYQGYSPNLDLFYKIGRAHV